MLAFQFNFVIFFDGIGAPLTFVELHIAEALEPTRRISNESHFVDVFRTKHGPDVLLCTVLRKIVDKCRPLICILELRWLGNEDLEH